MQTQGLNDTFCKISVKFFKFLASNENGNTTYQNLWNISKVVVRREFIAMSFYIKKSDSYQINNLMIHIKVCISQSSHCCDQIPHRKSLRRDLFILSHGFRNHSPNCLDPLILSPL
jgi:hypothetical protein